MQPIRCKYHKMKRFALTIIAVAMLATANAQNITFSGAPCVNNSIKITYKGTTNVENVSWNVDGKTYNTNDINLTFSSAGEYTVSHTGSLQGGDPVTETEKLIIYDNPKASFIADTTVQSGVWKFTSTSTTGFGPLTCNWVFGDNTNGEGESTEHHYSAAGTFNAYLIVEDANKCRDTATTQAIDVDVVCAVPNIFTPNGDGINDQFIIDAGGEPNVLTLEIFNRWGNRMCKLTGSNLLVWDGYAPEGTLVAPGTYYYTITVEEGTTCYNPLNGYITVLYKKN